MKKLQMFSIYDSKGERFDTPFFSLSDLNAKRHFHMMTEQNNSMINTFTNDFDLYNIGEFDVITSEITSKKPHLLYTGKQLQLDLDKHYKNGG